MIHYDVIICVSWNDVFVVKKTIKYIRINLCANTIYLIMNKENKRYFSDKYCIEKNIIIIDEDQLVRNMTFQCIDNYFKQKKLQIKTGWYFQQFLKMGFALSPYAKDYYLIWDADTLPLTQIPFQKNNKLLYTMKKEFHKPYFEVIERLWGLKKENDFSFIAEHMIIETLIMKEMINSISKRNSEWFKSIIDNLPLNELNSYSEFESYGTYVTHYYPSLYIGRTLNTWRNAGAIFGRNISDKEIKLLALDFDIISLETWCGRFFPANLMMKIQEGWIKLKHYNYMRHHGIKSSKSLARHIMNFLHGNTKIIKMPND